ncbi:hypothetical protein [Rhodococcus koreensis]
MAQPQVSTWLRSGSAPEPALSATELAGRGVHYPGEMLAVFIDSNARHRRRDRPGISSPTNARPADAVTRRDP